MVLSAGIIFIGFFVMSTYSNLRSCKPLIISSDSTITIFLKIQFCGIIVKSLITNSVSIPPLSD